MLLTMGLGRNDHLIGRLRQRARVGAMYYSRVELSCSNISIRRLSRITQGLSPIWRVEQASMMILTCYPGCFRRTTKLGTTLSLSRPSASTVAKAAARSSTRAKAKRCSAMSHRTTQPLSRYPLPQTPLQLFLNSPTSHHLNRSPSAC